MYSENKKENANYYVPIDVCKSLLSFWDLKRIWISLCCLWKTRNIWIFVISTRNNIILGKYPL